MVNSGARLTPFLFRSYSVGWRTRSVFPGTSRAKLWHAVRASAAAPTYFDEFRLDGLLHQVTLKMFRKKKIRCGSYNDDLDTLW